MAYIAHIHDQIPHTRITITDDRGVPASELSLPATDLGDLETLLSEHGWQITADWTTTSDGWRAPVISQ